MKYGLESVDVSSLIKENCHRMVWKRRKKVVDRNSQINTRQKSSSIIDKYLQLLLEIQFESGY